MSASNQYTTYANTTVAAGALTAAVKLFLPVTGNFQVSEIGVLLDNASAAYTGVITLKAMGGDGVLVTTGVTLTGAGETDGKNLIRRCDVKFDVTNSKIIANGVETAVTPGIVAVVLDATTTDADATGICYLTGMQAGNSALAATSNIVIKTS